MRNAGNGADRIARCEINKKFPFLKIIYHIRALIINKQ